MSQDDKKRKVGRPTKFTEALAARICGELATGKSLRTVCKPEGMPGLETIFRWLREKPEFRDQYAHAKNESADALVEEMLSIADDGANDWMEQLGKGGEIIGWKLNGEHVQRSRLRVDTRKWIASKLKPKKYGDQIDVNHGGQQENPLHLLIQAIQNAPNGTIRPVPQHEIDLCPEDDEL